MLSFKVIRNNYFNISKYSYGRIYIFKIYNNFITHLAIHLVFQDCIVILIQLNTRSLAFNYLKYTIS